MPILVGIWMMTLVMILVVIPVTQQETIQQEIPQMTKKTIFKMTPQKKSLWSQSQLLPMLSTPSPRMYAEYVRIMKCQARLNCMNQTSSMAQIPRSFVLSSFSASLTFRTGLMPSAQIALRSPSCSLTLRAWLLNGSSWTYSIIMLNANYG